MNRPAAVKAEGARTRPFQRIAPWLLLGWCVLWAAWIWAAHATLTWCPYGQEGCDQRPLVINPSETSRNIAVAVAGALVLLGLWVLEGKQPPARYVATLRRPWRTGWRFLANLGGVVVVAHLLLLAPMIDRPFCAEPIHVNSVMAYALNCDSPMFMQLAHDPGQMLTPQHPRQSRPGYIAVGALLTHTLGPVLSGLGLDRAYGQADSAYLPLVLINMLIAAAAVTILGWLLARLGTRLPAALALSGLLAVNELTKAFYWTPHQQIFALFVPLVTIAVARGMILSRPSWLAASSTGLAVGVAALCYGSFLITAGVVALVLLLHRWRGVLLGGLFLGAVMVPPIVWMTICKAIVGSYHSHELAGYHEFVWLRDSAKIGWGQLGLAASTMSIVTIRELVAACGPALAILLGLGLLAALLRVRLAAGNPEQRAILIASAVTVAVGLAFTWGIGIIASRLMFHVFPALLVFAGWLAARLSVSSRGTAWFVAVMLSVTTVALVAMAVLSHGPYS
jgi:hypothetical protein